VKFYDAHPDYHDITSELSGPVYTRTKGKLARASRRNLGIDEDAGGTDGDETEVSAVDLADDAERSDTAVEYISTDFGVDSSSHFTARCTTV